MANFEGIDDLLLQWEDARQAGHPLEPSDLCPSWPEGQAELRRRAELLCKFDTAFGLEGETPAGDVGLEEAPAIPGCAILGELGEGGMGKVYRAWQEDLNREVAVKVMRGGPNLTEDVTRRFALEARLLARLRHDHIVPVYEAKLHLGQPYFVMELVPGGSLAGALDRYLGKPTAAAQLMEQVARAVQHAHDHGVLHRDLKPANILLDVQGRAQVSDFGLAKLLKAEPEDAPESEQRIGWVDESAYQTATGAVLGTPLYMAPEQFTGKAAAVTPRTDVWALGVILYELLTGQRPFRTDRSRPLAQVIAEDTPTPPRSLRPDVPLPLQAIVLRCLEKDPAGRYPTAAALADDLARWLRKEPPTVFREPWPRRLWRGLRRRQATALGLGLAAVAALWGGVSYLSDPQRVREAIERDLAAGRPVTLVRGTGPPIVYTMALGKENGKISTEAGKPLYVSTHEIALVELWPKPPLAFLFRADIRNDQNSGDGRAGLYFDYRPAGPAAPFPCCYVVQYTDRGPNATRIRRLDGQKGTDVRLTFSYFELHPALGLQEGGQTVSGGFFFVPPPPSADPGPWRTVTLRVFPGKVEASWVNEHGIVEPIASVGQDRFEVCARALPEEMAGYRYLPFERGAVGLYVRDCAASFCNVVLEPLENVP
jgi:serine/threonine-protein kinase